MITSHPLVSIIVPCYNIETYIHKGLSSVLHQTYKHWECILINDGSTDTTELLLQQWVAKDERFQLISQQNKGLSGARNTGLVNAKGDCIYFYDPDDLLNTSCLESLVSLYTNTTDIVIGKSAKTRHQSSSIIEHLNHIKQNGVALNSTSFLKLSLQQPFSVTAWNKLYNATFLTTNTLRFKNGVLHEDELWFFETMHYANSIIFNNDLTYYYNGGNKNSITNNYTIKNLTSCIVILEDIYNLYYNNEKRPDEKLTIGTYIINLQITVISAFFKAVKKQNNTQLKTQGTALITEHLNQYSISQYADINTKKSKQFGYFVRYAKHNLEVTHRMVRNARKNTIFKSLKHYYLKTKL